MVDDERIGWWRSGGFDPRGCKICWVAKFRKQDRTGCVSALPREYGKASAAIQMKRRKFKLVFAGNSNGTSQEDAAPWDLNLTQSKEVTFWRLMKIESIALREIHMRLKSPFETSFGVVQDRRILLVEAVADGGSGWGEVTAGESPAYNAETTDTAGHVSSHFIATVLVGNHLATASEFPKLMKQISGTERANSGL